MNAESASPATVVLTLVLPHELEESLIDTLLDHSDLVPGFTSLQAEGHGQRVTYVDTREHVRGRASYSQIQMELTQHNADQLLTVLRQRFSTDRIFFWMVPALASGRLA